MAGISHTLFQIILQPTVCTERVGCYYCSLLVGDSVCLMTTPDPWVCSLFLSRLPAYFESHLSCKTRAEGSRVATTSLVSPDTSFVRSVSHIPMAHYQSQRTARNGTAHTRSRHSGGGSRRVESSRPVRAT